MPANHPPQLTCTRASLMIHLSRVLLPARGRQLSGDLLGGTGLELVLRRAQWQSDR
jgi:hypothetical protein